MISLDDRKWKQFKLTDIFTEIKNGHQYSKRRITDGDIPFAGASGANNGITKFIQWNNDSPKAVYKHCIGIVCNGISGLAYYYPTETYFSGDNVALFNKKLNQYSALFICTCIYQQHGRFEYGFKLRSTRFSYFKINLPVDNNGKPDWDFMTNYMKQVRDKIPKQNIHNTLHHSKYDLNDKPWKQFKIKDLFKNVVSGRHYPKRVRNIGDLPFISSKAVNNGIRGFYTNKLSLPVHQNTISVSGVGESGCAFYHKGSFINDRDAHVLVNPRFNINTYDALFICTCIYQQHTQFDYGFILKTNRLKNLRINLPVNDKDKPDWEFMTNYMKSMLN